MSKVRLNESHRAFLRGLIREIVHCKEEEDAEENARRDAEVLVRKMVEERYPPKEMKLLLKYDVACHDQCIRMQLTAGGIEEFRVSGDPSSWPLRPSGYRGCSGHIYAADEVTSTAVGTWVLLNKKRMDAVASKHADYLALICSARNLEDVEAVWPAASKVRERINKQLPAVLSDEVVARIRADVAATEKKAA